MFAGFALVFLTVGVALVVEALAGVEAVFVVCSVILFLRFQLNVLIEIRKRENVIHVIRVCVRLYAESNVERMNENDDGRLCFVAVVAFFLFLLPQNDSNRT